jgi:hypothetical protein
MQRTAPKREAHRGSAPPRDGERPATTSSESHREAAQQALAKAQRNPIRSAEQFLAVAQINALLAIEAQLAELGARDQQATVTAHQRHDSAATDGIWSPGADTSVPEFGS